LLISILLPALSAARRQSNAVKCLSNLRQIGLAFSLYSGEYKGFWPVAVHETGNAEFPMAEEHRWPDMVAPFVSSTQQFKYDGLEEIRKNSVIWGCPEWTKTDEYDPANPTDRVRVGYGMNYYCKWFEEGAAPPARVAYINAAGNPPGRYTKQIQWTKAAERGLIADAIAHVISTPGSIDSTSGKWQPYDPVLFGAFYVDARRHLKPTTEKKQSYNQKGINMLFCDGHAAPVSVREAWNAIHNPGSEAAGN
jgi:prepilin-type processing-associated H-X9-DG protein